MTDQQLVWQQALDKHFAKLRGDKPQPDAPPAPDPYQRASNLEDAVRNHYLKAAKNDQ